MRSDECRNKFNIIMLKAVTASIPSNHLILNKLKNVPFRIAKRHVLSSETGHIMARNVPFCIPKRHIPKINATQAIFSYIFASIARSTSSHSI